MLIKALCDYYDVLAAKGKVVPDGYTSVDVSYLVSLTPEGKVDGIIDCRRKEQIEQKSGKIKEVLNPVTMVLPKRTEKPGVDGNIVEHRPLYIFGLNYDAKSATLSPDDSTDKAKKSHDAFVKQNKEFFADLDKSEICRAYIAFLDSWKPECETNNEYILSLGKDYSTAGFAFCIVHSL